MVMFALKGLWDFIPKAAVAALAAALACFLVASMVSNAGLKRKVATKERAIATLQADLTLCQSNREKLEAAIVTQNDAVAAAGRAAAAQNAAAMEARAQAAAATADLRRRQNQAALAVSRDGCGWDILEGSLK
jgi:hypothetical protein